MDRRIAVLLTNDDTSDFAAAFPNDGEKVVALLQPWRPAWSFEVFAVKDGVFPSAADDFHGYVITGSPASVNDAGLPWLGWLLDWVRALDRQRLPLIGLCFGHQAVARALGGEVVRHAAGWGLGAVATHWREGGAWMQPSKASTVLMAAHNEQVLRMPDGARCLGGNDFCPIGSMQIGQHIWTTQYHPEMTLEFMQALLGFLADKLDVATVARARASLMQTDAKLFARWMVQFFEHAIKTET